MAYNPSKRCLPPARTPRPFWWGKSSRIRQVLHLIQKLGKSTRPGADPRRNRHGQGSCGARDPRRCDAGPFVPIDCSALVGPLMESELFGHTRGAFTGAAGSKTGLVEIAEGGTALLRRDRRAAAGLQAKLLRLIQEKEYRPVGSVERRKADFRVIAATNRDLAREVERGAFRRDLYYRLNVVTLRLPALRDSKEDIPRSRRAFPGRLRHASSSRHASAWMPCSPTIGRATCGNWRTAVQRMVAINSGPLLHTADLPSSLQNCIDARKAAQSMVAAAGRADLPRRSRRRLAGESSSIAGALPSLTDVERTAIIRALEYTKGDRVMAAHLLGIGRTTLYRKLKEYRLTD